MKDWEWAWTCELDKFFQTFSTGFCPFFYIPTRAVSYSRTLNLLYSVVTKPVCPIHVCAADLQRTRGSSKNSPSIDKVDKDGCESVSIGVVGKSRWFPLYDLA